MTTKDQLQNAVMLLRSGRSDEDVERLTGIDLGEIISLRALLAAGRPSSTPPLPDVEDRNR